jgi:mRNA interferase MazF
VEDRRIVQGDVFWVDVGDPDGSSPGYPRPYVVVQNNLFNRSGIRTVVTCALTSNLRRAGDPGNVLLVPGEADLPEQSVVNVSQVLTVDKRRLGDRIGSLSGKRVREVVSAIELLLEPRDTGG